MTNMDRPVFHLQLRPEPPRPGDVPPAIRLRRLLKIALRSLGLRCTKCEEQPAPGQAVEVLDDIAQQVKGPRS
jgi:hypothetical protein